MSNAITHISEEPITASICSPLTPTVAPAVNWDAAEAGVAAAQDPRTSSRNTWCRPRGRAAWMAGLSARWENSSDAAWLS